MTDVQGYCPEPDAVSTLLEDQETEHIVVFTADGWTVRHPLRERLRDELMACTLPQACRGASVPGRYRARRKDDGGWSWERLGAPP